MIEINRNPSSLQLRQFAALWFPAFGAAVGLIVYGRFGNHNLAFWIWGATAAVAVVGLAVPPLIRFVFVGMMILTYPIGWVVSNLILIVIYYLVLTPIGLLLRLSGRDSMGRSFDRETGSYWIARPEGRDRSRYFRQY